MQNPFTLGDLNKDLQEDNNEDNSTHAHLDRCSGHLLSNDITLSANNAAASVNIFQITGSIEVYRIYGSIKTAGTLTDCDSAYFDLYDSTTAFPITKNDGDIGGMGVGTFFSKEGVATVTMTVIDPVAGSVVEPATDKKAFTPFIVTQKTGANTYVRFTYTTTDTPIAAVLSMHIEYREPPSGGGTIVAV